MWQMFFEKNVKAVKQLKTAEANRRVLETSLQRSHNDT